MKFGQRIFNGTIVLSSGEVLACGCSFIRNAILARLLTKTDFGIAATFVITVSLLEMISNISNDRLLVQSKDGDEPSFQATVHLFQLARGLATAAVLFMLAYPFSWLFKVPEARWAFQLLAVIPLMNGLKHHDVHRFEREMRFGPIVLVEVIPQVMITIMAWTVARMTGNYAAVLWLLIARSCVMLIISHAVAERPYRVAWDPRYVREMLTFGWPLLVNGVLLFGVFQGDRLIAGAGYSMEDLAVYSVAATLAVTPTFMLLKIVGAMMLPLLSRSRDHQPSFQNHYILCTRTLSLIAAIFGLWFIVAGQSFVVLVYGEKYAAAVPILGWLVAGHALRVMRAGPTVAAMALGDTRNLMISNVVRCLGLFLAVACAWGGMGLSTVAACGLVGETLAFFAAGFRLSVHHRVSFGTSLRPAAFAVLILGVSVILSTERFMEGHWGRQIWAAIGLTITALVAAGLMSPELRKLYAGVVNFGPKMFVHSRPIDTAAMMKGKPD